jgi:hypothetical protein
VLTAISLLACLTLTTGAVGIALAGAQTTTTAPVTTTGGTTGSTTTVSGGPPTTTSSGTISGDLGDSTTSSDDSGSDIPWVPIAIAVVVVVAIIILVVMLSLRRGRRAQAAHDWRSRAADATAEIGATARLLSAGNPATPAIVQQILTSLRAFDDLAGTAPDGAAREAAQRGRRIVQTLGRAIDSDHTIRRAQPPAPADRIEGSAEMLRGTAADSDRALRALYRGFTETS